VGGLGSGADETADLPAFAPRVGCARVTEILPHGPGLRLRGPVVVPLPAGVLVETLGPLGSGGHTGSPSKEQSQAGNPVHVSDSHPLSAPSRQPLVRLPLPQWLGGPRFPGSTLQVGRLSRAVRAVRTALESRPT